MGVIHGSGPRPRREPGRQVQLPSLQTGRGRFGSLALGILREALSLEALPFNILAFLVGRATVLQTVSPFGVAFFTAALALYPKRGLGVGLAVAAGVFSTGAPETCLEFAGAAAGLTLLFLAFDRSDKSRSPATWAALAFTVTAAAGSVKAMLTDPTPYRFLIVFFAGLVTFVLTLVYLSALPALASARRSIPLGVEQIIALALTAATALAGLSGLGYAGLRVSGVAGGFLVLVSATVAGGAVGAGVGTATGVVAALCGTGGLSSVGLAALAGLLAGSFRDFGKLGTAAGFFFGALLLSPLVEEVHFLQAVVLESALAAGLFVLVPDRAWQPLRAALKASAAEAGGAAAEVSAREGVGKRLTDLGVVFGQLAATLKELSAAGPSAVASPAVASPAGASATAGPVTRAPSMARPAGLASEPAEAAAVTDTSAAGAASEVPPGPLAGLAEAACRVCQACRLFKACWRGDVGHTREALSSLLEVTAERGQLETRDVPAHIRRRCVHLGEMVTTMNFLHEIAALNGHWRKKLDESRGVVSQQLDGLAQILRQLGQGLAGEAADDAVAVEDLVRELDRAGFPVREVSADRVPGGRTEFAVTADNCATGDACREIALPVASHVSGSELVIADLCCGLATGHETCAFRLAAPRQLDFRMGVTQARKSTSGVSGDSYLIRELPGNRLAAVLSDGTGAGPRAAEESRTALRMLEELLRLGFSTEMAVRTINSMLLLRSTTERFATLDLLTVDLYDGQARFVKVGAPPSYVRRGRDVSAVSSANLPLGVLPEVSTEGHCLSVRPGDLILLATDGLFSAQVGKAGVPEDSWIVGFLKDLGDLSPQETSDALVEAAVSMNGSRLPAVVGGVPGLSGHRALRDDITVMALTFGQTDS